MLRVPDEARKSALNSSASLSPRLDMGVEAGLAEGDGGEASGVGRATTVAPATAAEPRVRLVCFRKTLPAAGL